MMEWKRLISDKRLGKEDSSTQSPERRTEFQRDFDRLIFSAPFRRMQNKTQVFPLPGSIFVHNRLTHSLEVSSVGRSLGTDVARELILRHPELASAGLQDMGAIVSAACLAHDMGNPPFGHSGERAIRTFFSEGKGKMLTEYMSENGDKLSEKEWADLTRFDGNANTFRLLTHQFGGRRRGGFVMTYSTLASIVKYPFPSVLAGNKSKFGFFTTEEDGYLKIAQELGIKRLSAEGEPIRYARHPLVFLVEAADDICYQMMDIEDAYKLKLLTPREAKELYMLFLDDKKKERVEKVFDFVSDGNEQIAYLRATIIGILIQECTRVFMENEEAILDGAFEGALIKHIGSPWKEAYQHCSKIAFEKIYRSRDVLDIELAGFHVISTLLELMINAVQSPEKAYSQLLINRVSSQYDIKAPTLYGRIQAVLDYLSGMTDGFALDLFRKIKGNGLPAV